MIHFKDKTFCDESTCIYFENKCDRAFTEAEKKQAIAWWGGEDFPIALFSERPNCYKGEEE